MSLTLDTYLSALTISYGCDAKFLPIAVSASTSTQPPRSCVARTSCDSRNLVPDVQLDLWYVGHAQLGRESKEMGSMGAIQRRAHQTSLLGGQLRLQMHSSLLLRICLTAIIDDIPPSVRRVPGNSEMTSGGWQLTT